MSQILEVNLDRWFAGDHKSLTLSFEDAKGTIIDLNNRRIVFTMKEDVDNLDSEAAIKKILNISEVGVVTNLVIDFTSAETNTLLGVYEYDLRLSFQNLPTEIQYTALRGKISVDQPVTKSME